MSYQKRFLAASLAILSLERTRRALGKNRKDSE